MSRPATVYPLRPIEHLPLELRLLALTVLNDPRATPDHLLVIADALDEIGQDHRISARVIVATRILATDLRSRAPDYA